MNKKITFSIIIPCYNSEEYIDDAIVSVLDQTYSNLEIIIVNDGSTDKTESIAKAYCKKDNRIKYYYKENGGYSTAINYGLEQATGSYVVMLGSDDTLDVNLLRTIIEKIPGEDLPDYIAFRAVKITSNKTKQLDNECCFDSYVFEGATTINNFELMYPKHSKILFVRDTAKCYKRELIKDLRYFGKFGYDADGIFSTLYSHKCKSFMCIPYNGYLWTIRDNSVSAKTNFIKDRDRINNWDSFFRIINNRDINITRQEKAYIGFVYKLIIEHVKQMRCLDIKTIKTIRSIMNNLYEISMKNDLFDEKRRQILRIAKTNPLIWCAYYKVNNRY